MLIICTLLGVIKYVGPVSPGTKSDINAFREELKDISFVGKDVLVDLGFYGLKESETGGKIVMPHKKPKGKELTGEQKAENKNISAVRVIVENAIAGCKHFLICQTRNRFKIRERIDDFFVSAPASLILKALNVSR
jgi:DDE superfamily endonuclease